MVNKYSNVLTMFLIVFIIAILGIIGYFTYDLFIANSINSNAHNAIEEFESTRKPGKQDTSGIKDNEEDGDESEGSFDDIANQLAQNTSKPENSEQDNSVYMEDYRVMGTIKIPKTGIEYPILECVTKRSLELSVAIAYGPGFNGIGSLNDVGNTVIYGHNYRNGLFFSDNKKLAINDEIFITDESGNTVTYRIYNIYQTGGDDASFFTRDTEGRREISLQTCTDNSDARIIIWATEK